MSNYRRMKTANSILLFTSLVGFVWCSQTFGDDTPADTGTTPTPANTSDENSSPENPIELDSNDAVEAENLSTKAASDPIPIDDIRIFVEVFHKIKNDYVETVSDKELIESAMRGMLAGLDPHSGYLDEKAYDSLQEGTTGEFGGLGIEVGLEDGFVRVISPIDDTPAQRAGIQAGDLIIRLDDTPVKGMSLNDAVNHMRGEVGTDIVLTILRDGEEKPLKITLVRDIIKVKSVRSRMLEPGIAYLRVSHFQARTGNDLRTHVIDLKKTAGGSLQGAVLDLRNNPGGVLGAAVGVSDVFLDSGLVVYTEGRVKNSQLKFNAKPPDLLDGAPLIVLVNEGSASASEIVAGALQDRRRAIIMGRQTFGKGSVQTILPMNNQTAIKLTTARYYTPAGRSIQAEGITPDIIIDKLKIESLKHAKDNVIKEANLSRHLVNGDETDDEQKEKPDSPTDVNKSDTEPAANSSDDAQLKKNDNDQEPLATSDYELYEALNLLKGMILMQARTSAPE